MNQEKNFEYSENEYSENDYFVISNLHKTWKNPDFVLDFSASIEKGKTLGIMGRSGSGKSTVLLLTSGLLENSPNEKIQPKILLEGKDITNLPPSQRKIGMVFQSASLFPHLTVLDNVAYGLRFSRVQTRLSKKESREKAFEFLAQFEMQDFAERYPENLSGGEAQRVSLARTLILSPKVIFFDEPFASLDKPIRKKLMHDIKEMQEKQGFSSIFVTHDTEEAKELSDKITVLKRGKQIWTGKAEDFTESLLGTAGV